MASMRDNTIKTRKRAVVTGRARTKRKFPAHLDVDTPEEWRALKRTEWKEVMQALERYGYGAAYTPAHSALYHLEKLAQQIDEALQVDKWIAW